MKNATRKLALILVALVMVLSLALTACETTHDFTVKVVGPDNKPYTTALVQPCLVGENGELVTCYDGVETDKDGVAYLDLGKEVPDKKATEIEIHLLNLPSNLTYTQPVRMKKGETKTIKLTQVQSSLSTPQSGSGTGSYMTGDDNSNKIELSTFDPYVVTEGSYSLLFTSASQKIFYEFIPSEAGIFKVYSTGYIDASIVHLQGTRTGTLYRWLEDEFVSDDVSDTDLNFCYQFEVEQGAIDGDLCFYFEVSIKSEDDVDSEAVITFQYVSEGNSGSNDPIDVNTQETLVDYADPIDDYYPMPLDGSAVYVKNESDGFYHKDTVNGPIVFADLGTDSTLNTRHVGINNTPNGLGLGFTKIVAQGATLVIEIDKVMYDYLPMITAYTTHSNSYGRYPLTDELIDFLGNYLTIKDGIDNFEERNPTITLPQTNPWLVWCGFYEGVSELDLYEGEGGGGGSTDGGSEEDAIILDMGRVTITVPEGGVVYYTFYSMVNTVLEIVPYTNNCKLEIYKQSQGVAGKQLLSTQEHIEAEHSCYQIEIIGRDMYFLLFSTVDGEAETYDVMVGDMLEEDTEGTRENPIVIDELGTTYGETTKNDGYTTQSTFYTYTVTANDTKLYFYAGAATEIRSIFYVIEVDGNPIDKYLDLEDIAEGYEIAQGTVLYIEVAAANDELGWFDFSIYNAPLGSQDNPIVMWQDENDVDIPENGSIYFIYYAYSDFTLTIYPYTENTSNIILHVYVADEQNPTPQLVTLQEIEPELYGYQIEMTFDTKYVLVFSTADHTADSFQIKLVVPEPEAEEGSEEKPIVVDELDSYSKELVDILQSVYYSYTVTSGVSKLYFDWDSNTSIIVSYNGRTYSPFSAEDMAELRAGIDVEKDAVVIIEISLANPFEAPSMWVSFEISDQPISND